MIVKAIINEDFTDYKKPSMFIACPRCNMKCGAEYCQNNPLLKESDHDIDDDKIIKDYLDNNLTQAIVFGGLEPMDSKDLWFFILKLRREYHCYDDVVIYTGYTEEELENPPSGLSKLFKLRQFPNIIVKFGRYIPNQKPHYDELLGVNLASDNQYAKIISPILNK